MARSSQSSNKWGSSTPLCSFFGEGVGINCTLYYSSSWNLWSIPIVWGMQFTPCNLCANKLWSFEEGEASVLWLIATTTRKVTISFLPFSGCFWCQQRTIWKSIPKQSRTITSDPYLEPMIVSTLGLRHLPKNANLIVKNLTWFDWFIVYMHRKINSPQLYIFQRTHIYHRIILQWDHHVRFTENKVRMLFIDATLKRGNM